MNTDKSRKQTVYEFFQTLQVEWIVADLRSRIYPQASDKSYWTKVKEGKKIKIETIAEKNFLPTIFVDSEMKRALENKVYNAKGVPAFLYKDPAHERMQRPLDLTYYYAKDADVRFESYGDLKIGKIKSYVPFSETIVLISEEKEITVPTEEVTRII
jgi:hypothetical protein